MSYHCLISPRCPTHCARLVSHRWPTHHARHYQLAHSVLLNSHTRCSRVDCLTHGSGRTRPRLVLTTQLAGPITFAQTSTLLCILAHLVGHFTFPSSQVVSPRPTFRTTIRHYPTCHSVTAPTGKPCLLSDSFCWRYPNLFLQFVWFSTLVLWSTHPPAPLPLPYLRLPSLSKLLGSLLEVCYVLMISCLSTMCPPLIYTHPPWL